MGIWDKLFNKKKKEDVVDNQIIDQVEEIKTEDHIDINYDDLSKVDSPEPKVLIEENKTENATENVAVEFENENDVINEETDNAEIESTKNTEAITDVEQKDELISANNVQNEQEMVADEKDEVNSNKQVITENSTTSDDLFQEVETKEKSIDTNEKTTEDINSEDETYDAGLKKTRLSFSEKINKFLANFRSVDESFFEDLEETLISADVGFELSMKISDSLREEAKLQNAKSKDEIKEVIIKKLVDIYEAEGNQESTSAINVSDGRLNVVLFVGVNGVGKTTTIGKLANRYKLEGKKVILAAADTFRAGAVKQLQEWGIKADVPVVSGKENSDPASVVYTALETAINENYDVLLVDTAGRLQNNVNLMRELEKMKRIISKKLPDAPHEVLLVLDASTGQNALQQAKLFKESADVTGIVLTKLDGTAKGGIILAIRNDMHLPVKLIGLGEKITDLKDFRSEEYIYNLFKDLV